MSGLRGRTELDEWFYRPEVLVNGRRQRLGFEARWRPGPFSVKSEFIRLTDERLGQSIEETDLSPFSQSGMVRERHVGSDRREEGGGIRLTPPATVPRPVLQGLDSAPSSSPPALSAFALARLTPTSAMFCRRPPHEPRSFSATQTSLTRSG